MNYTLGGEPDAGAPAATEGSGFGPASDARRYTGVEPEPRRSASPWLADTFVRMAKRARSLFASAPTYPRSFNWDEKTTLPLPGAQGKVEACVSYAGCLTAAIRYQLLTGKNVLLAPRVFHFCTLKLACDQGTNSSVFGSKAIASGLPCANSESQLEQAEQLLNMMTCDAFDAWPRLRVSELVRFETFDAIKWEISSVGPVVAHISLHDGFLNGYMPGTVYQPPAGSSSTGKHAICLIGYDEDKDYWIGINSGGPGWGGKGRFMLQYGTCDLLGPDMPVYAPRVQP